MSDLARTLSNKHRQSEVARFLQHLPTFTVPPQLPKSLCEQLERLQTAETAMRESGSNSR
ncbi:hypothetical protein VQ042_07015 [Aurantimonas sp. A2-1-M11]|uniref:hypothetical protein n=1 Tax=Aurantimonas sp. A2-1-M11 TaxID=3113712 RepID=UPI002F954951